MEDRPTLSELFFRPGPLYLRQTKGRLGVPGLPRLDPRELTAQLLLLILLLVVIIIIILVIVVSIVIIIIISSSSSSSIINAINYH